ncbi:hypothetical protein L873DRAFT_1837705 [Choiromyces venosus 120613-1]|uniref:Uncharacterized protein n=1 Tax=Choiromyces venosus 120613-1 TaxID=1336337 RepID=A0A3N4JBD7_9PEZI|nr:hypothetical protein L873DRAFT_1837705 [Choiromyces venosus 120613-1]
MSTHRTGDPVSPISSTREDNSDFGLRGGNSPYRTGRPTRDPAYSPLQRQPSNSSLSSEDADGNVRSELHYYLTSPPERNPRGPISISRKPLPVRPTVTADHASSSLSESVRTDDSPVKGDDARPMHWMQALWATSPIVMMTVLFLLGIAFAVGHYAFYKSWRDNIVEENLQQEYIIRAGTAFAFLSKASLVGAVVVAHKQIAWDTVRKRAITVDGIDAMFVAPTDFTSFLNGDMIKRAKVATLLALLAWCIPISAIITPGSLSVNLVQREYNITAPIPSTNFSDPTGFTTNLGLSVLQDESRKTNAPEAIAGATVAPSPLLSRIVSTTATSGSILPVQPPHPNSSYVYSFHGPSLRCIPADLRVTQAMQKTIDYDKSGRIRYAAIYNPEIKGDTCSIYIGLAYNTTTVQNQTYSICSPNGGGCMAGHVQKSNLNDPSYGQAFSCELYNTFFTVNVTFRNSVQRFGIQTLEHLTPVSCVPLSPPVVGRKPFAEWEASYAVFAAMGDLLVGNITKLRSDGFEGVAPVSWDTKILQTTLIGSQDFSGVNISGMPSDVFTGPLARGIEELSRNITLSLLSSDTFGLPIRSDVLITRQNNRYIFNETNFWLAYGIAIFVTAGAVLIGIVAYYTNGVSLETNFSTVMATTQTDEMRELASGVDVDSRVLQGVIGGREVRLRKLRNGDRRFVLVEEVKG